MPKKKEVKQAVEATEVSNIPEGKVLVNDAGLKNLLARMDLLESKNAELQKEINATADRAKLDRYRTANTPKGGAVVTLNQLEGVTVLSWTTMPVNICEKDPSGRYKEEQTRVLLMEDGTEKKGYYSDFTKSLTRMAATIISRTTKTTDIGEVEILTVAAENGKDYEIDKRFINA